MTPRAKATEDALAAAIADINKTFGEGSLIRMNESTSATVHAISTGIMTLDAALGVGGLPRGRITEIYGPEGSGKTSIAQHLIASAQKQGGVCAILDMENSMDGDYATAIGVDVGALLISQPLHGEQAFEIVERLLKTGQVDVIVVDSVAALVPRAELEGSYGDASVGLHARLMSQSMRKLTGLISESQCVVVFINQIREKIGVMYGSPEVTTGGRALQYYASVRLDVRRKELIKNGEIITGNRVKVKMAKNKCAPPLKVAEFDLTYGVGASREGALLDVAEDVGVITRAGAWYTYEDSLKEQGREATKSALIEQVGLYDEIETKVKEVLGWS